MARPLRQLPYWFPLLLLGAAWHPATVLGAGADADDLILELQTGKPNVFQHEPIALTVTLQVGSVPVRNIRYPRVKATGIAVGEFAPPRRTTISRNGRDYAAYEFVTTLTPSVAGESRLGPAELECDLLAPASGAAAVFGGSEPRTVTVHSQPVLMEILPLPAAGRPADFSGAVGRFTVSRKVAPTTIRTGDPFVVTTHIRGVGAIEHFSCPVVDVAGVRAYPPQVSRTPGDLRCRQTLVAAANDLTVPAATISYFDPNLARYVTRRSTAVAIRVMADGPVQVAKEEPAPPIRLEPQLEPEVWSGAAWTVLPMLILVAGLWAVRRGRQVSVRVGSHSGSGGASRDFLADAEIALNANDPDAFYLAVFRQLQIFAVARSQLPPSRPGSVNADDDILASMFRECDAVRYGRAVTDRSTMSLTLDSLRKLIV